MVAFKLDGAKMKTSAILKHPTAFLPITLSLCALATVLVFLVLHGPAPQVDEGAAAHIWQLLMAAQVPVVVIFMITWVQKFPKQTLLILAIQVTAALTAMAPVYFLHW
jgi:hypothetical protein